MGTADTLNGSTIKKDRKKRLDTASFARILIIVVAIQSILIFAWHFSDMMNREISASKGRIDQSYSKMLDLVPTLKGNEETMTDMYEYWLISRYRFISERIDNRQILNGPTLEDNIKDIGISGAFVTDSSGEVIYRAGDDPVTSLPYTSGEPIIMVLDRTDIEQLTLGMDDVPESSKKDDNVLCYMGFSDDNKHYIMSGELNDGRLITIQVPTRDLDMICRDTLNIDRQVRQLGYSAGLDIMPVTYDKQQADEDPDTYLYEDDYRQYYFRDGFCIYRKTDDPFFFFMGKKLTVDDRDYVVCSDIEKDLARMVINALQSAFIAAFFLGVLACLIFCLSSGRIKGDIKRTGTAFSCFCLVIVLLATWFWRCLCDTTDKYHEMECLVSDNNIAQEEYRTQQTMINKWLDEQCLIQSLMAADQCADETGTLDADDLFRVSNTLGIEYIYVMDRSGKTVVTNSPNDAFEISKDEKYYSSAFLPLLSGGDHVVTEPVKDESGTKRQYIGVGMFDKNGVCSGCVISTFTSSRRDLLTGLIEPSTTLKYSLIGSVDEAYIIDRNTGTVVESDNVNRVGLDADQLDIPKEVINSSTVMEDNIDGCVILAGSESLKDSDDINDNMLVMIRDLSPDRYFMRLIFPVALFMILSMAVICLIGVWNHKKEYAGKLASDKENASGENGPSDTEKIIGSLESEDILEKKYNETHAVSALIKTNDKYLFDQRWKRDRKKIENMSVAETAVSSLRIFSMIFAVLFILPAVFALIGTDFIEGFPLNYVFRGNWNKGLNVFSVAEFLLVLALLVFLNLAIRELLYQIARISTARVETICLLIRSTIKYVFAIGFVIFILSQIGISATTILASAGVLTMVIGLGAQSITADLISGIFLIFERTFDVGDAITVDGKTGIVTEIGLRTTKLNANGDTLIINNSSVKSVINRSGDLSRINVEILVPNGSEIKDIEEILSETLPQMKGSINGLVREPKFRGISNLSTSQMALRFSLYAVSYKRSDVRMEFLRRMKLIFDEKGIVISGGTVAGGPDELGF